MTVSNTPSPEKPFSVAIIGGGLGGVVLGIGLQQQNVPFHIYEAAATFGEIGAGVAFGPNSVRALGLISPALLEAYLRHATMNEAPELFKTFLQFRKGTGELGPPGGHLFDIRGGEQALSRTGLPTRCCIHRARFLDEIVKLLPAGSATFGRSLVEIVDEPDGGYLLKFANGSTATASVVVGCDGIRSPTRQHIHGKDAKPVYAHEYAYRAFVPRAAYEEALGPEPAGNGQIYVGQGGYIITYPVEHGTWVNMVAARNTPGSTWDLGAWQAPSTTEDILKDFEGWHPTVIKLLIDHGTQNKWALFDNKHKEKYCKGRICLLGDAAHATTPHLGAGAGMAMEDSYILSNLLGDCQSLDDVEKAFEAYDYIRRPRSQELVRLSRLSGLTYSFHDENVKNDVEKLQREFQKRYDWLWDADLKEHLQKAREFIPAGES